MFRLIKLGICAGLSCCAALHALAAEIHVSPTGNDTDSGSPEKPVATLAKARDLARTPKGAAISIILHKGTYYLPETLVLSPEDSGTKESPVVWSAAPGESVVISGGQKLELKWEPHKDGIWKATVPADFSTDQLFVNGESQPLARYPNFNPNERIFNGYAPDAIAKARVEKWADPAGGFIHTMHGSMWGGMHYQITGKDAQGNVKYEGGWQNNRASAMHGQYRFVENIFEELDAPGEWFLNTKEHILYFYPPKDLDPNKALIESVRLRHLIEFKGSSEHPVKFVTLRGFTVRGALRSFMENREPLLRTDWTTYRGGAFFVTGSEDCAFENLWIDQVGGNAIFVNNYNRRLTVRGCHISNVGANGVALIGDPAAVRSAGSWKGPALNFKDIDKTPGPLGVNYPAECLIEECLIHQSGRVEKQTAPVEIDMAQSITVRHCSLYDVPRAGLNIGDGCWGGHLVEFCDIFDTVKETGDHGSFNSWGRDRFWGIKGIDLQTVTLGDQKDFPKWDVVKPNILRNNRWRCDHGWDIDLDDGSTNYEIRNNLCLNGGIKNREGFYRTVENNIMVNNSFHPHVWYKNDEDVFRYNIVFGNYRPAVMGPPPWGKEMDFNFRHQPGAKTEPDQELKKQSGRDEHSMTGDAMFVDPANGNFQVKEGSPALALGFKNFPMDQFGVQVPELKALARTPSFAPGREEKSKRDTTVVTWQNIKVRNVAGMGDISAHGLAGEVGVLVVEISDENPLAKAGLVKNDVILEVEGKKIVSIKELPAGTAAGRIKVFREQRLVELVAKP